jgi:hypothetical protein
VLEGWNRLLGERISQLRYLPEDLEAGIHVAGIAETGPAQKANQGQITPHVRTLWIIATDFNRPGGSYYSYVQVS